MSLVSDPSLRSVSPSGPRAFDVPEAPLPVAPESTLAIATMRRRHLWWINGTLALISSLLLLRLLASALAAPLETIGASAAPAWQVEVTTSGDEPGIALAYGPEVGIQLLRIPAGNSAPGEARVVPARLARGELHLLTLSLNALRVRAPGAPGSGVVEFTATGPIITAYQTPQASGVRTGW